MIAGMNLPPTRCASGLYLFCLYFSYLLGGSGDAGGGRAAGGAGRRAAGVRNGDVEEEMAPDATVTIDDEVSTTPARLVPAAAGRPDVVEMVSYPTSAACVV